MDKTKRISTMLAQRLTWYAEANSDISQIKDPNIVRKFEGLQRKNEFIISSFLNKIFLDDTVKEGMISKGNDGTYTSLFNFTKDKDIAFGFHSFATSTLIIGADICTKNGDSWNDIFAVETKPMDPNVPMLRYVKNPPISDDMPLMDCYVRFLISYKDGYLYFSNENDLNTVIATYIENKDLKASLMEVKFYIRDNGIEGKAVDLNDMTVGELFNILLSKNYEVLYDKVNNRGLK